MAAANFSAGPRRGRIKLSRGFARRLNPGRGGKCAHGRSRMAAALVSGTRAGRGTRICVHREVPRVCVALASHSGSCKHGCGEQSSRQKLNFSHSSSPLNTKSQQHLAPQGCGFGFGRALQIEEPQARQDSVAVPHQSGDRRGDCFIPANFACRTGISIDDLTFT